MMTSLDLAPETLNKLLHLAEQANRTPEAYLGSLLSEAEQRGQSSISNDDVLHQWVLANISDTVFITQDDGVFTYVCPNIHTVFGYTDYEVWQFGNVNALGLGNLYQAEELITVGEIANIDTQITDKTGTKHHLLVNIKRVGLGQGTVLYVCRDNTSRKRMETRLAALYEATSHLFQADSLFKLGEQVTQAVVQEFGLLGCRLMMANAPVEELTLLAQTGATIPNPQSVIDLTAPSPFHQAVDTGEPVYLANTGVIQNHTPLSQLLIPLRTLKGVVGVLELWNSDVRAFSEIDLLVLTAFASRSAAVLEIMYLYEEINRYAVGLEQRVIERTAELQQKSDQIEAILNHSGDAITLVDADGTIQQANHTFFRYFGQTRDETHFHRFTGQFNNEQATLLADALAQVFRNGQSQRLETLALRQDDIPFDADVLMSPIIGDDQQVVSVICSLRDITERKHIEMELRRSLRHEKALNEIRSRFVSTLSHEYRTPLAIILSSSEILLNHSDRISVEQRQKRFQTIRDQIRHMTALLDDLVESGTTETAAPYLNAEAVDICAFCRTVASEVQSSVTTHRLEYSAPEDCGIVLLDKKLMRQVIHNLLSNAIKYSPAGSTVYFELECGASEIRLHVKDQGIGIPEEDLEQLFEVYFRAHNVGTIQGSGLGLPIIKRAVEAHDGRISVESEMNVGTLFTVTLPRKVHVLSN